MYCHLLIWCCFWFILYSQFLNVSTNLYKTVHYVRAIEILHFWQLIINVFLVILSFLGSYKSLAGDSFQAWYMWMSLSLS